jgi:hypothetical protein
MLALCCLQFSLDSLSEIIESISQPDVMSGLF